MGCGTNFPIYLTRFFNMSAITTGAPKMAVTALMESSTGENSVRAIKSQPAQKMAPPKKHAGITRMGFDDFSAT